MSKIKLFLSYGRRDAEDVALRLKKDIEPFGYEIWMDRSEIKAGTAWAQAITEALESSQAVVALLSPHSVRVTGVDGAKDDSVCLNELAYARECPGKILPVMVADCRVPFVLYQLHYVDLRSWRNNEAEYQRGLQSVLQGIEAALRNEIHYRSWQTKLQPWDFTPFLEERRRGFVGRHWLFAEVQNWLEGSHKESCLIIAGDPGIGKSAFVGQWVHLNPGGRLLAYHCCQIDSPTTLQPYCFVRSLAAMIASQIPEYESLLQDPSVAEALREETCRTDPGGGFEAGILAPLHRITPPEDGVRCILVDALDEALMLKDGPTIVDVLADRLERLPSWLRIVATTRREPDVLKKIERLRATPLYAQDQRNIADAMAYLSSRFQEEPFVTLARESGLSLSKVIEVLLDRSNGNFLYLHYALEGLALGNYHLDRPEEFPPGLPGFYEKAFRHRFVSEQEYTPAAAVLAAVLAAHEPLDIDLLQAASGLTTRRDLSKILKKLAVYLPERNGTYSFFHRSLAEWLRDSRNNEDYCIEPVQGDRKLAEIGWANYEQNHAAMHPYMVRYLPHHLAATGQWDSLVLLLSDLDVFDAIWKAGREHEWMRFWRMMMDKVDMVKAYRDSIDRLLARGADRNESARISGKVGALLRNLGLHEQALPFVESAANLLREAGPTFQTHLASALLDLAETHRDLRNFEKAEPLYEEVLHLRERRFGLQSPEVGDVVHAMCVYYNTCTRRDVDKAILLNERAISIREKYCPPNYAALADSINDKAVLLFAKGQFDEVLAIYQRSRELFEKGFPDGHPELGVVICNIGECHVRKKDYEQAIACYHQGIQMRSLFVVPYDDKCQMFRRDLVTTNIKLGRFSEALDCAQQVLTCSARKPRYEPREKFFDFCNLVTAAALAGKPGERDQGMVSLIEEIKKLPDGQLDAAWKTFADLQIGLLVIELRAQRVEEAFELFSRGHRVMADQQSPPMKALAYYHQAMAGLMGKIMQPELEQKFTATAKNFEFIADRRMPYLNKLGQVNELINTDNLADVRTLVHEVVAAARADEPPDPQWLL